jgi:hypothetical protein
MTPVVWFVRDGLRLRCGDADPRPLSAAELVYALAHDGLYLSRGGGRSFLWRTDRGCPLAAIPAEHADAAAPVKATAEDLVTLAASVRVDRVVAVAWGDV